MIRGELLMVMWRLKVELWVCFLISPRKLQCSGTGSHCQNTYNSVQPLTASEGQVCVQPLPITSIAE